VAATTKQAAKLEQSGRISPAEFAAWRDSFRLDANDLARAQGLVSSLREVLVGAPPSSKTAAQWKADLYTAEKLEVVVEREVVHGQLLDAAQDALKQGLVPASFVKRLNDHRISHSTAVAFDDLKFQARTQGKAQQLAPLGAALQAYYKVEEPTLVQQWRVAHEDGQFTSRVAAFVFGQGALASFGIGSYGVMHSNASTPAWFVAAAVCCMLFVLAAPGSYEKSAPKDNSVAA
jgi:hypothetical protein